MLLPKRSDVKLTWCQIFTNDVVWQLRLTFAGDDAVRRLRVPVALSYLSPRVLPPPTEKKMSAVRELLCALSFHIFSIFAFGR